LIVSHGALLVAVQGHPAAVLTLKVPVPPVEATFVEVGLTVGVHDAPAWVIVNVEPAIVIVPVRGVPDGLAATA
jgi:hypothetical protein